MEHYSAMRKKEILLFVTTEMDNEGVHYVKWDKSDRKGQTLYDLTSTWNLKKAQPTHRYREQISGSQRWGVWVSKMGKNSQMVLKKFFFKHTSAIYNRKAEMKGKISSAGEGGEQLELFAINPWRQCKLLQPLWKTVWKQVHLLGPSYPTPSGNPPTDTHVTFHGDAISYSPNLETAPVPIKGRINWSSPLTLGVKELGLSQLWPGSKLWPKFHPWPGNFRMLWAWPKTKQNKTKQNKTKLE